MMMPHDCKCIEDIEEHLVENLRMCDDIVSTKAFKMNGKEVTFKQIQGFRRAFCIHGVYKASILDENEKCKNLYAFHVSESTEHGFPNMGIYTSMSELIREAATIHARLWKLN